MTDAADIADDGLYSGAFRWAASKRLPELPPLADEREAAACVFHRGWPAFLRSRHPGPGGDEACPTSLTSVGKSDPSLLDGLSFPLTVLHAMHRPSSQTVAHTT